MHPPMVNAVVGSHGSFSFSDLPVILVLAHMPPQSFGRVKTLDKAARTWIPNLGVKNIKAIQSIVGAPETSHVVNGDVDASSRQSLLQIQRAPEGSKADSMDFGFE